MSLRGTENGQNRGKRMLLTEVWFMDTKSICPTVDELNALPGKVKRYIHDLEMRIKSEWAGAHDHATP
jgi:hypothetical protein